MATPNPSQTTYSIFFVNDTGRDRNYGFLAAPPDVKDDVQKNERVYSNVLYSSFVRTRTHVKQDYWHVDVSDTYYAWAGTSSAKLPCGHAHVTPTAFALPTISKDGQLGSSFAIANDGGSPIFDEDEYSYDDSAEGSFQISTDRDLHKPLNFVHGVATPSKNGTFIPMATVPSIPEADTFFTPQPVYYIVPFAYKAGTVIGESVYGKDSAIIDFTCDDAKGLQGALVKHIEYAESGDIDCEWEIDYLKPEDALKYVRTPTALHESLGGPADVTVTRMKLSNITTQIQDIIQALTIDVKSTVDEYLYEVTISWGGVATKHSVKHAVVQKINKFLDEHKELTFNAPRSPYRDAVWTLTSKGDYGTIYRLWEKATCLANEAYPGAVSNAEIKDRTSQTLGYDTTATADAIPAGPDTAVNGVTKDVTVA